MQWSLSDKIAVGACIAGFAQFLALLATIWTMHRFGRRQLRAYIALKQARVLLEEDGNVQATIELYNCGQTPAYAMKVSHMSGFSSYPLKAVGYPPENLRKSYSILGAGGSFAILTKPCRYESLNRNALLREVENPNFVFGVRGYCTYEDIFGKTRRFRFQVIMGGPSAPVRINHDEQGQVFAALGNDSEGNDGD